MRVLAVLHGELVGPELFGEVISEAGHELLEWQIAGGGAPPPADAVLVLGGHQNVGEEADYPWLEREYDLLRGWVADATPLLTVCLGAQALAHALGGAVEHLPARLAGFRELELTAAGRADPLTRVLPERFPALFANAYGFTLPAAALPLALDAGRAQAFRVGERAWGVQFHPEARREQVLAWWRIDRDLPRPLEALAAELGAGIAPWQRLGRALCSAFLAAASS